MLFYKNNISIIYMSAKKLDEMAQMISRKKPDMGDGHRALTENEIVAQMNIILKEVNQVKEVLFFLVNSKDEKEKKALLSVLKSKLNSDYIPNHLKETIRTVLEKEKYKGGKKTRRRRKKKRKTRKR